MDALIAVRFIHYTATLLAGGTIWFVLIVSLAAAQRLRRRLDSLAIISLAITVLSGAAWLVMTASDILGTSLADICLSGGIWPVVTDTRFGQVAVARVILALVIAVLLAGRRSQPAAALLAIPLIALPALTGHAGAMPGWNGYGAIAADMGHLLAAAAWLGGLPAFALMLASGADDQAVVRATRSYGRAALAAVGVLIVSGTINSWHLVNSIGELITTDYGRVLSLKLLLFVAMLGLASVNRFRLTPALPAAAARRALTRNALVETGLGAGVLLLVAALGTLPPGAHAHHDENTIPPEASFVHIHDAEAMADVTINPGRVGTAAVTIRIAREDFSDYPARNVRLELDTPNKTARSRFEHAAVRDGDGVWHVDTIDLMQPGIWTVRVVVTPETGSTFVLDAPIVIAR